MRIQTFTRRTQLPFPAADVFEWHARAGALERLLPPWTAIRVEQDRGITDGAHAVLAVPFGPLHLRWIVEYRDSIAARQFRAVQIAGPFARWERTQRVTPEGTSACVLEDIVEYALPLAGIGNPIGGAAVTRALQRTFTYRHRTTRLDLTAHAAHPGPPLHVLVSGAGGLVGKGLVAFLAAGGHRVSRLVRPPARGAAGAVGWDPVSGALDMSGVDPVDAVVHLAGENVVGRRWTAAAKRRIRDSRVPVTEALCRTLAGLRPLPRVLVCASAVGYYGDRGEQWVPEDSAGGDGFLAGVAREWEAATAPAVAGGIRVVPLRIGMVLSSAGGALATMLPLFRLGLGGRLGSGAQYMSWIGLDDLLGVVLHALRSGSLSGPVNAVAPQPVTNAVFTQTLARVLSRPALLPVPAPALRLALGEMADEMLLAGARVEARQLRASGYSFRDADLETALRHTLGRTV